jgi:hypothetical protein
MFSKQHLHTTVSYLKHFILQPLDPLVMRAQELKHNLWFIRYAGNLIIISRTFGSLVQNPIHSVLFLILALRMFCMYKSTLGNVFQHVCLRIMCCAFVAQFGRAFPW